MSPGDRRIWLEFRRGNTARVLEMTIDGKHGAASPAVVAAVVGALVFSGRLEEAEALFTRSRARLGAAARVEARFFLAVGFTRHSDDARSRRYLGENFRERREASDAKSRFYLWQGFGFRRFFSAEYRLGLKLAARAAEAATRARFVFGKAFALELLGHCQAQSGEISLGLRNIGLAIAQARLLGDGGLARSFRIAETLYRAQFGRAPERIMRELAELAGTKLEAFPYSRANVLLELSRQYRLRGDLERAGEALNGASPLIYALRHRRCAASLKLRYASLVEARGDSAQALQLTRGALAELNSRFDRGLEIEIRGMEARLLRTLGLPEEAAATLTESGRLSRRAGKYMDARMQAREGRAGGEFRLAEDPIGDLIDQVARKGERALEAVIASGYLGLCSQALGLGNQQAIVLRGPAERPLLFDQGSVFLVAEGFTPLMKSFLRLLSQGDLSKEAAIKGIWGYAYSPLRHDPLIYRLAARTRAALGAHARWLEMTELGYRLAAGVAVHRLGAQPEGPEELGPVRPDGPLDELNFRQLGILRELKSSPFLDVRKCRKLFGVSEVTARRDLSGLLRLGELDRIGKGRAVKYQMSGRRMS